MAGNSISPDKPGWATSQLPSTTASLSFLDSSRYDTEKPYYISIPLPPEYESKRTNLKFLNHEVTAYDLQDCKFNSKFEWHKFQYFSHPSRVKFTKNPSEVEIEKIGEYLRETVQLVKKTLVADWCFAYSYVFRRARDDEPLGLISPPSDEVSPEDQVKTAHVDATWEGGPRRICHQLKPEEQEKYVNSGNYRLQILNFWRPLHHVAYSHPLVLCDPCSIDPAQDLIATDRVGENYSGEVYYLRHNLDHRWLFVSAMTPDEALLFLSYDSEDPLGLIPHASFRNTDAPEGVEPRESIEVRLIAFTKIN